MGIVQRTCSAPERGARMNRTGHRAPSRDQRRSRPTAEQKTSRVRMTMSVSSDSLTPIDFCTIWAANWADRASPGCLARARVFGIYRAFGASSKEIAKLITLDYRASHLSKGHDYDEGLAGSPFDDYMTACETRILEAVASRHFSGRIPRYLDFACGTGRITTVLAGHAHKTIGIDVSDSMVAVARRKLPDAEFLVSDITRAAPSFEPFDLVTAFRFMGNAQDELRQAALRALGQLIRPGGLLVLNNHRSPYAIQHMLSRLGRSERLDLTASKLERLLRSSGFQMVETHAVGWWIVRAALMRRNILESAWARRLERFGTLPGLAAISPDTIIVARKTATRSTSSAP